MTNPSPTLARIQAEHPTVFTEPLGDGRLLVHPTAAAKAFDLLLAAVRDQDRQLAERDERIVKQSDLINRINHDCAAVKTRLAERNEKIARLREQLAEAGVYKDNALYAAADYICARQEQRRKERE